MIEHSIGVIADTHGLLRPEALHVLEASELIIHAGDIGAESVVDGLAAICTLRVIKGNVDTASWAASYPDSLSFTCAGKHFHVLHDLKELKRFPAPANVDVIISAHSHKPAIDTVDDVLYLNPGSAGRRRFDLPVSVARIIIRNTSVYAEILELET